MENGFQRLRKGVKVKKELSYKIAIGVLLFIVIAQWVFILSGRPRKLPRPPVEAKARIAIVIDDWGYNLNNLYIIDEIKYPMSVSVLPNLNYSREVAEGLHKKGLEIILHLPMEPREKYRLEKNTIMVSLDKAAIKNIISRDLADIVYAQGVSNHMGSLATGDLRTMEIVFKELKARGLYFLDSLVSGQSVCSVLAGKLGLDFARRDVFLDNTEDPAYIRGQLVKLKLRAKNRGWAIGIGHDRKVTLQTLKELMPQMEKEGYRFVFVSELAR